MAASRAWPARPLDEGGNNNGSCAGYWCQYGDRAGDSGRARSRGSGRIRNDPETCGCTELSAIAAAEKLPIKILPMDVDDDGSVSKTVAEVLADAGRIDVLVNNAAIQGSGPVEELPLTDFRRVMEL